MIDEKVESLGLGDLLAPDSEWSKQHAERQPTLEDYKKAELLIHRLALAHDVPAKEAVRELAAGKTVLAQLARKVFSNGAGPTDNKIHDFLTVQAKHRSGLRCRILFETAKRDLEADGRHVDPKSLKTMFHRTKKELQGTILGSFILDDE